MSWTSAAAGLALGLARLTRVKVTALTQSKDHAVFATRRIDEAGLGDQVTVAVMDYRDVQQQYDRIVSVGMFEHAGVPSYRAFLDTIAGLLTENGMALLHAVGRSNGPGMTGAWTRRYNFPGACAPALSEVLPWAEKAGLRVTDIELLRLHCAETLRHWRERFLANIDYVHSVHDERFCRMWEFFLAASEMEFRYGNLMVFEMQLAKRINAVPLSRDYVITAESAMRAVNALPVHMAP